MKVMNHITVTTHHTRQSPRSEVAQATLDEMVLWVRKIVAGENLAIFSGEPYVLSCDAHNENMLVATLHTEVIDIIRLGVCLHVDEAKKTWALVNGTAEVPCTPFVAVELLDQDSCFDIPWLGDFERSLAWGFVEYLR